MKQQQPYFPYPESLSESARTPDNRRETNPSPPRRMRTIGSLYEHYKNIDPDTAITKNSIRDAVIKGKVPSSAVGNKRLISIEDYDFYLRGGTKSINQMHQHGVIRPVNEGGL